jgi:hypothetical protein
VPRIECQISTPLLLKTLQQLLEPRVFAQCLVSPIPGLYLDRIEIGVQGPITQSVSNTLNVAFSAKVFAVTNNDVQAAQGGPPSSTLTPNGVPLTGNIVASISGTKMDVKYDGIVHDAFYTSLLNVVAEFIGGIAAAKELFSQWEGIIKNALNSRPLANFDFESVMPPQAKNLTNGRSALCANSRVLAARFEVGAHGGDGSWQDFVPDKLAYLIGEHKWALFISGDVLVNSIKELMVKTFNSLMIKYLGANALVPFSISGEFGLLAKSGPEYWSPFQPVAPETASVSTFVTVDYKLTVDFLGITIVSDQGDIVLGVTMLFTVSEEESGSHDRYLNIPLYYSVTANGLLGSILVGFYEKFNDASIPMGYLEGFSETDAPNYFTSRTLLPPVVLEDILTLTASGGTGTVLPPLSATVQEQLASLSSASMAGFQIVVPESGLLIYGDAKLASGKSVPDCVVSSTQFALIYNSIIGSTTPQAPFPDQVPAIASFSVSNKGPHPSDRYPLIIGSLTPVLDPTLQWLQNPSVLPQTPLKAGNIVITIPESQFRSQYMSSPYPLSLIVCTNGGARFVSLGQIPVPEIDPATGMVENFNFILTFLPQPPPAEGSPPGPHHPLTPARSP